MAENQRQITRISERDAKVQADQLKFAVLLNLLDTRPKDAAFDDSSLRSCTEQDTIHFMHTAGRQKTGPNWRNFIQKRWKSTTVSEMAAPARAAVR
ncbi:hypothetical protein XELAEV_18034733mg [Xenopus laevis]|uniref:Uncharacterized protein n=1 Tax=Xenopus laevis TaxID=8355 RepID=A0A974CEG9_XENLA|nr:hypothetical protein XELAEV_18034733mg [Xenopus laevis]